MQVTIQIKQNLVKHFSIKQKFLLFLFISNNNNNVNIYQNNSYMIKNWKGNEDAQEGGG